MLLGQTPLLSELARGRAAGPEATPPPFSLYPPRTRAGLDPAKHAEFPDRMLGLRRAHLAHGPGSSLGSLQLLDLDQIRVRFARRWPQVREKAMGIVEAALQRELGRDDAYVAESDTRFYLFRIGLKRPDAERRGRLLAADITERLCGAIPGGVAVKMRTAPFDFDRGFAGVLSFEQLRTRIDAFGKAVDDHELRLFLDNAPRLEAWFRPTIQLRKGLISIYHLAPGLGGGDSTPRPVSTLCPTSFNGVFDAEIDGWAVQEAASILAAVPVSRGRGAPLIIPVRYETLAADRFREGFLGQCRHLPSRSRRRLLIEVLGLPPTLPQADTRELLAGLRPHVLGLLARLPHDAVYAEHLVNTGILGLSLDLGRLDPDAITTQEIIHMLVDAARDQRMRSFLVGAASVRLCHHAHKTGVDYLNGDGFMPSARQPGRVFLAHRHGTS
jgi:hypothetical protein